MIQLQTILEKDPLLLFIYSQTDLGAKIDTFWQAINWQSQNSIQDNLGKIQNLIDNLDLQSSSLKPNLPLQIHIPSDQKLEEQEEMDGIIRLTPTYFQGKKVPEKIPSSQELAKLIATSLQNTQFTVTNISQKSEKSQPRPPFITSSLQQAASTQLSLPPKITMQLAQKLYEGVEIDGTPTALITYMRTDSVTLSGESIAAARKYLQQNYPQFLPSSPRVYKSKANAQEAHEAIRPTNLFLTPLQLKSKLEAKMWRLYDLIWRQTMASQMTEEIRERVSFDLENLSKDRFSGSTSWTTSLGWKVLWEKEIKLVPQKKQLIEKQLKEAWLQEINETWLQTVMKV